MAASKGDIEHCLRILHGKAVLDGQDPNKKPFFASHKHLLAAIDDIQCGDAGWTSFSIRYNGPLTPDAPAWKRQRYVVHTRNALRVAENMSTSADFKNAWHTRPYEQYDANGSRVFSDVMSASWAWKEAVRRPLIMSSAR